MFRHYDGVQPAARCEISRNPHPSRGEFFHKVVQYAIGEIFIKHAFIAEALVVELEAFKFHTDFVGDVFQCNGAIVWLACLGTYAGEFRGNVFYGVVPTRVRVVENVQNVEFVAHLYKFPYDMGKVSVLACQKRYYTLKGVAYKGVKV